MAAFSSLVRRVNPLQGKNAPRDAAGNVIGKTGTAVPRDSMIGGEVPLPPDIGLAAAVASAAARQAAARARKTGGEQNVLTKAKKKTTGDIPASLTPKRLIGY